MIGEDDMMGGSSRERVLSGDVNRICPDWVQCNGNADVALPSPVPVGLEEAEYRGSAETDGRCSASNCSCP